MRRPPAPARRSGRVTPVGALVWVALLVAFAAGLAVKLACTHGGLLNSEVGIPGCYSDVVAIFQARGLSADPLPYAEVRTEYPPLTAALWLLAQSLTTGPVGFLAVTGVLAGMALLVTLGLLRHLDVRHPLAFALAPAVWWGALLNWDALAVALMVAAVVAHRRAADAWAGVLIGLGTLAKLFPLLLAPFVLAGVVGVRGRRAAVRTALAILGTVVVGVLLVLPVAGEGLAEVVRANVARPADWDSAWFTIGRVTGQPLPAGVVNVLSLLAGIVGSLVVVWQGRRVDPARRWELVLPVMAWLLLSGKVYSPQFSLWLLPLVVILVGPRWLVVAFLVADGLVLLTRFPFLAGEQDLDPALPFGPFLVALVLRAGVLLLIIGEQLHRVSGSPAISRTAGDVPAGTTSGGA